MALFIYFFQSFFDLHFLFKSKNENQGILLHPFSHFSNTNCPLISPPPSCGGERGVSSENEGYGVGGMAVVGHSGEALRERGARH